MKNNEITFEGNIGGDGECFVFKNVEQSIIDKIDPPYKYIEDDETSVNFGKEIVMHEPFLYPNAIFRHLGVKNEDEKLYKFTILVEEI